MVYDAPPGEVWHGRVPNLNGRKTMICLMGCATVTPEYATTPLTVPEAVIAKLPPRFRKGVGGPFDINDPTNTMIDRLWKARRPASFFSLEYWAKLERRFAERISEWISDLAKLRTLAARLESNVMRLGSALK